MDLSGHVPSKLDIPLEIIYYILELFMDPMVPQFSLPLLLVSREIHEWALPKIYFTFDLAPRNRGAVPVSGAVDREKLVQCASPRSLAYTKQLQCWIYDVSFSLAPFRNLSHLMFWGTQVLIKETASVLLLFRLEELFIWSPTDTNMFHRVLLGSKNSAISTTLCRLGFYAPHHTSWQEDIGDLLPKVTHILILSESSDDLVQGVMTNVTTLVDFQCCLVGFPFADLPSYISISPPPFEFLRDKRFVFARKLPHQFSPKKFHTKRTFWTEEANMWKNAEMSIAQSPDPSKFTFLQQFPEND
ncbi:hypothetical protein DL96DRAFT_1561707 [Flagelloscypha sp. PMI_526]|nr:hypothetical protein DL96DRAFT_1561707 [Flagelloscypha sp. PMI_526]